MFAVELDEVRVNKLAVISISATECPKIYRKSVLHLLKYTANLYFKPMQYRFAVNFETLSTNSLFL